MKRPSAALVPAQGEQRLERYVRGPSVLPQVDRRAVAARHLKKKLELNDLPVEAWLQALPVLVDVALDSCYTQKTETETWHQRAAEELANWGRPQPPDQSPPPASSHEEP